LFNHDIRQVMATVDADVSICCSWLRGTAVERRSVTGELSLSYTRPAADG